MEENQKNNKAHEEESLFSIKDYLEDCLSKWKWFVCSILICCCLGVLYVLTQQPVYTRTISVLIKDKEGSSSADLAALSFMGFGNKANVNNELITLTSPSIMGDVVKRLDLQTNYLRHGTFHGTTLYGSNLPFTVLFNDLPDDKGASFKAEYNVDGTVRLYDFHKYDEEEEKFDKEVTGKVDGTALRTPIGRIVLVSNPSYVAPRKDSKKYAKNMKIKVWRSGFEKTVQNYTKRLVGKLADKEADVINLTFNDVSTERATDILNSVIDVYNTNWVEDNNRIAVATSKFIDERLQLIEAELGAVEGKIFDYRSRNRIPDLQETAKLNMKQNLELSNNIMELSTGLAMANYVRDYIANPSNNNNVIPTNTGVGSVQLENQIASYNALLLERNKLAESSSASNPLVLDYDASLRGVRESILKSVQTNIAGLQRRISSLEGAKGAAEAELAESPSQAKYLLSVERQQKVKESLYVFLLQKREENELSQTFTAYNTRVITPPTGPLDPIAPRKKVILVFSFMIGFAIPALLIYILVASDGKVRSRKELEHMETPFAGEIPFVESERKGWLRRHFSKKPGKSRLENVVSAVREGSRDVVSESFRIVRGNIDFMSRQNGASSVIMLTSFNPGSGKSFIAYNLAASFALKGKKVLIIDGDLRHGSVSQFVGMPSKGLGDYLTAVTDDWKKFLVPVNDHPGVSVLPIGHRPPNPSELLDNGRLGVLIEEARKEFDYIFFDCPPVDIVVDTQIVEKYVDRTLFVVRAGLLEKKSVAEIDEIYRGKRFRQMSIILNGTDRKHSRHSTYGSYGYHGAD